MKTEVYSWRLSSRTKADLEAEARLEGVSVAEILSRVASQWLRERQQSRSEDASQQAELHARVAKTCGTLSGGDPQGSERVRDNVRARLERRRAAKRPN